MKYRPEAQRELARLFPYDAQSDHKMKLAAQRRAERRARLTPQQVAAFYPPRAVVRVYERI